MQAHTKGIQPNPSGAIRPPTKIDASLGLVRKRALELHTGLRELQDQAAQLRDGVGPQRGSDWRKFLEQYDTLSIRLQQLTQELERAMTVGLHHFVTIPLGVTDDPTLLPDLLRTRLEANVEREFENLGKRYEGGDVGQRIANFNDFVLAEIEGYDENRLRLMEARGKKETLPVPSTNADAVLAAVVNGTGLRT